MSPIFVTIFFQGTTHWHTGSCQVRFVPNVGARSVHAAAPVRPGARHRSSALASCEGGAPPKPPWPLKGCGMEGGTLNPTLFKEPFKKGDWDPNKYPFEVYMGGEFWAQGYHHCPYEKRLWEFLRRNGNVLKYSLYLYPDHKSTNMDLYCYYMMCIYSGFCKCT